jgi:hypothetical protein
MSPHYLPSFAKNNELPNYIKSIIKGINVTMAASVAQWSELLATDRSCIEFPVKYELNI